MLSRKVFPYEEGTESPVVIGSRHSWIRSVAKFFPMRRELKIEYPFRPAFPSACRKVFPYEEGTESGAIPSSYRSYVDAVAKFFPMRRELKAHL